MDREFNDGTIGCIVRTDESLREKEESGCEVGRVFLRHVQRTCLTGESPLSRPWVARTLRLYNYLLRFHLTIKPTILKIINYRRPTRKILTTLYYKPLGIITSIASQEHQNRDPTHTVL